MAGTTIKRKARKNRVKAKKRIDNVKRLTFKPVLKNIDIEGVKATFNKKTKAPEQVEDKPVVKIHDENEKNVVKTKNSKADIVQTEKEKKSTVDQAKDTPSSKVTKEKKQPELKKEDKDTDREDNQKKNNS